MKKKTTIDQTVCDNCGKGTYGAKCLHCGKDWCYDCEQKGLCVEYPHAVHFGGGGDGHYCADCDKKLAKSGRDTLHNAYTAIKSLRNEYIGWYEAFKRRTEHAEKHLAGLDRGRHGER